MKHFTRKAVAATATAILSLAGLVPGTAPAATAAAPVRAAVPPPTPAFDMKADCPALPPDAQNPEWWTCMVMVVAGGSLKLGGITQQLNEPMRLVIQASPDAVTQVRMDGRPMTVPGGVLALLGLPIIPGLDQIPGIKLQVKPHYAGGFKLELPNAAVNMRVQILNALVGGGCFIGTDADPIKFNLAMDPNGLVLVDEGDPTDPMAGPAVIYGEAEDKTFAVPKTNGCGLVGPIADWKAGLPSPPGKNSALFQSFIAVSAYAVQPAARRVNPLKVKVG